MPATSVCIGIDVACGKQNRLPICFVQPADRLSPLDIPADLAALIPAGPGNVEIMTDHPFAAQAAQVASALRQITQTQNWHIERIAIDAPAIAPVRSPRACEDE